MLPADTTRTRFVSERTNKNTLKSTLQGQAPRNSLRLAVLKNTATPLPDTLIQQVMRIDPDAQIRNSWDCLIDRLTGNSCHAPDVIVGYSDECGHALEQLKELWNLRVRYNYSTRPIYLAITAQRQPVISRLEIERAGGYFLHAPDVPNRFSD